ncbi:hypothetical protein Hypma_008435, partial [Hypsizygus marmoreus]
MAYDLWLPVNCIIMPPAKRNRCKQQKKSGRTTWVKGTKLVFLEARKDEFLAAHEAGHDAAGRFYTKVACLWLLKYGYDLPLAEDIEADVPDPTDDLANAPLDFDGLDAEEDERRTKVFKVLKNKLGQWYRHRFKVATTSTDGVKEILNSMHDMSATRPRKPYAVDYYSSKYYEKRVKAKFDDLWNQSSFRPTARIAMCRDFTARCWEEEPQEFRESVEKELEEEYQQALQEYRNGKAWLPQSAEEYDRAMEDSPQMLIPFADAISQRLGVYVAVLMVGPTREGRIGLRSIHSTTVGSCIHKTWPEADPDGFFMVERSITAYGSRFFSKQQCEARRCDPQAGSPGSIDKEDEGVENRRGDGGREDDKDDGSDMDLDEPDTEDGALASRIGVSPPQPTNAVLSYAGHGATSGEFPSITAIPPPPVTQNRTSTSQNLPVVHTSPPTSPTSAQTPNPTHAANSVLPTVENSP